MPDLTTGTVTFLFSDIEESARLWGQRAEAVQEALGRHDALADEIIPQQDGRLVKDGGQGDSLFRGLYASHRRRDRG